MRYQKRLLQEKIARTLNRGKSILLFGARQTGKTTLLKHELKADLFYDFALPKVRRQFEQSPDSLSDEIEALLHGTSLNRLPLVIIDEVQKAPLVMDVVQSLIDNNKAQFILTGSSARKLKRNNHDLNLLPGRVIKYHLDALSLLEMPKPLPALNELLCYGSLPNILFEKLNEYKEEDLISYVDVYLEEEIRQEAMVRNMPAFSRFLELASLEAGNPVNITKLSQEIGITIYTIKAYFQILEDCLIIDRIEPITQSKTRKRLTKAPKYLFFDLGVRRVCAKIGDRISEKTLSNFFEEFVGIELLRYLRCYAPNASLKYWRDHNGPEIDFIIDVNHRYLPIEVKWTSNPSLKDCRHIEKFMKEYPCCEIAYVVCQIPRKRKLSDTVLALPWQELSELARMYG